MTDHDSEALSQEWEDQQIVEIPFDKLVLWSENPRDPINPNADNTEIIRNAMNGRHSTDAWRLDDLALKMGGVYDLSELPIVVYDKQKGKYIVYDGNRRIALALIGRGDVPDFDVQLPLFPQDNIPCNVCSKRRALEHVLRKHGESGSWSPYHRDLFLRNYMGQEGSVLVRLQELIGAVDKYPTINQRYVRDEILDKAHLIEMGLNPDAEDFGVAPEVLENLVREIVGAIERKEISTRTNRKNPVSALDEEVLNAVRQSSNNRVVRQCGQFGLFGEDDEDCPVDGKPELGLEAQKGTLKRSSNKRRTARSKPKKYKAFGGILQLECGNVNNLYRTLDQLWRLKVAGQITEEEGFVGVFRAGLRLLVEAAAREYSDAKNPIDAYVTRYEDKARALIRSKSDGDNIATFLQTNGVEKGKLVSLLNVGAHVYTSSCSEDQALAMSLLIGSMISVSHGRQANKDA